MFEERCYNQCFLLHSVPLLLLSRSVWKSSSSESHDSSAVFLKDVNRDGLQVFW